MLIGRRQQRRRTLAFILRTLGPAFTQRLDGTDGPLAGPAMPIHSELMVGGEPDFLDTQGRAPTLTAQG